MRAGGCAVQQALAAEAAAVVRQAVALARRRGHAQVTPLHVASAMLSAAGLLRGACLRSHSHPLQCKALELCFNVALNRLPTAGPAAAAAVMFHHYHHHGGPHQAPVLSNALVAAFKRAQAHQRRGAVEGGHGQPPQQPQPVVAARVEIEQLIISILDDPSVSRVMREAGFSSSQVKDNVEKAVSSPEHQPNTTASHATSSPGSGHARRPNAKADDDAMRVLDCMASGSKRCVVVVGESTATAEVVVKAVMDRVSKGELQQRHERLKNLQFVPLSAASFQRMSREEVEAKAGDLRALVRQGCAAGKGVVLVLEDLAYAAEAWAAVSERRRSGGARAHGRHCYCPVEHAVMEVSSLASAAGSGRGLDRFWLLGSGNNQAYMKCRAGQPSLEAVWELHPVVVPDGGLTLSLSCDSDAEQASQERSRRPWPFVNGAATSESELTSCAAMATPSVPPWLHHYQDQDMTRTGNRSTSLQLQDWNPNCYGSAAHHTSELTLSFSSPASNSPDTSSMSGFAPSFNANLMMSSKPWQFKLMQPWPNHQRDDPLAKQYDNQPLHANLSPESYSVSNSSVGGSAQSPKLMELTAENLKILCNTLENRAPRHKDVVADIASAVLQCRSGMTRRMRWCQEKPSAVTWLLFQGGDDDGKKAVSQELARLVFGSYSKFTSISLVEFTQVHSDSSSSLLTLKRQRSPDTGHGYFQRLYEAILENPHRVIMIDGIEQLDYDSEISIRNAIANGRIRGCNGDEISLEDAIVVLSCEALDSRSNASSPRLKQRVIDNGAKEGNDMNIENGMDSSGSGFTLDLNACAEDGEEDEESASDNVTILNIVDGVFLFQSMEDL
ncbi:Protein SMAX1-LIKE 3 [Dichanthelium oligosanthes]|uniref:Protein SMAX1-LIKE 3 n=1 Tax=Dichanthelium oligosanthes TaxID=888268 RepID=A0A1E5UUE0_9POAL|nr:Protein SMAX1-LIKE 3 [Dichanthelium oligosanthes]